MRRLTLTAGVAGSCLVIWATLPLLSTGAPTAAELEKKIDKTQAKVQYRKGKEKVLTQDIAKYSSRVATLEKRVGALSARQSTLEEDLSEKREVLGATQAELRAERARLIRLQKRFREVEATLEDRLVEQYKEGRTDLASVIVEADGFQQLLERGEFLGRLAQKDQQVIKIVATAKTDATRTEKRLDSLERRQQKVTAEVAARRNEVARVRSNVAATEATVREARNGKRALLSQVKVQRKDLEEDLAAMQAQQARISGALNGALPAGAIKKGTGSFIYPMNGTFTSPFGQRWGRLHAGIDIAAPIGTPIRAVDGGRVAIAGGVSGYGNYTCIQHSSSLSSCYAHQSSIAVKVGQTVTKGQVIGLCGNTGNSTGPHLHFEVRVNGNPQDPMGYL
ncbi:MAG: peptidoglycan DD-metalloendopeptidase family protein [Solirubrobacteraceae bacterium]|nr:peptidoglycan DD-metalloendopeptidase family protein [Solirubrobacteraceae bacterium]